MQNRGFRGLILTAERLPKELRFTSFFSPGLLIREIRVIRVIRVSFQRSLRSVHGGPALRLSNYDVYAAADARIGSRGRMIACRLLQ